VQSALRVGFSPIPRGTCLLGIVVGSIVDMCLPMRLGAMTRGNEDRIRMERRWDRSPSYSHMSINVSLAKTHPPQIAALGDDAELWGEGGTFGGRATLK
jgi:hypothetical protein